MEYALRMNFSENHQVRSSSADALEGVIRGSVVTRWPRLRFSEPRFVGVGDAPLLARHMAVVLRAGYRTLAGSDSGLLLPRICSGPSAAAVGRTQNPKAAAGAINFGGPTPLCASAARQHASVVV